MNLAILIGISNYNQPINDLPASSNDVTVFKFVLDKLNKFNEICLISKNSTAYEAKQKITEFVSKYKESEIDELVFYFSGHGARYEEDFFYVFSDFSEKRKEVTGLRNTELDGLIRNLSPNLTVKIVDACYSGSSYVKSEFDIQPIFEKSAKQNQLNKLYFLHSSSSEEESLASKEYSMFSHSIFSSLTQDIGKMRYRDVMAYVADDMENSGYPKPTFIIQADNTELFGEIDQELIDYLKTTLGFSKVLQEVIPIIDSEKDEQPKSFLQLIQLKSDKEYCTQEQGISNLEFIRDSLQLNQWPTDIQEIFDIEIEQLQDTVPNESEIGRWLLKNKEEKYFVMPRYTMEHYEQEEYIEVPKKPTTRNKNVHPSAFAHLIDSFDYWNGFENDKEYRLEKVEKTREVLVGIKFITLAPFKAVQINFKPKFQSVEKYVFTVVPIFSHKRLEVFYAIEVLTYTGWNSFTPSTCKDWKIKNLLLKDTSEIENFCTEKKKDVVSYIMQDINSKLEK